MKALIINADDYGIHEKVNAGIEQGYDEGCITSTSIMAGAQAFAEAAAAAKTRPGLGIGVHLTLVGGRPVSSPDAIPSLVDRNGMLPAQYPSLLSRYLRGKIELRHVYQEFKAQIEKVRSAGLAITHLDSHQHQHVLPGMIEAVIAVAKEYHIAAVRIPAEGIFFTGRYPAGAGRLIGRTGLTFLAEWARRKITGAGMAAPQHFFGMLAGGHMNKDNLLAILSSLPDGVSEIMVHPGQDRPALNTAFGWNYCWEEELAALTDPEVLKMIEDAGIRLIHFGNLPDCLP